MDHVAQNIPWCFAFTFQKSESHDSLLQIEPKGKVGMQYGWALEFTLIQMFAVRLGLGIS